MVEKVNTGGMMDFDYSKSSGKKKLSEKQRAEIVKGYEQFHERRKREKKRNLLLILLVILIIVAGLIAVIL